MIFDKLTAEELEMIDTYRRWYAFSNEAADTHSSHFVPAKEMLHEWASRKGEYLEKLFDGELTITKRIKYVKSYEELQEELGDMISEYSHYGRAGRNGYEFQRAWNNYMYRNRNYFTSTQEEGLRRLMSDDCLIKNTYDGVNFEIEDRDGKKFRVNRGAKTSKALGKLAQILDLPGFEDFRICHSQILNQKELGGNLTISIHPLDYMTMSDNSYGWESCMSWSNEGGYRQGTVEMMNSRSVIVAYLSGDEKYKISDYGHEGRYWNSKKWRQLFVVDHNVIIGVKDYPYHNDELGKIVVKWLRELAAERLGWTYKDLEQYSGGSYKFHFDHLPEDKNGFTLEFSTGSMYSDFGCLDYHWMCMSTDIDPEEIHANSNTSWKGTPWMAIPYSGRSQCMVCGDLSPNFEDESCLACEECQSRPRCDCCGEITGETWRIDGMELCEYCWENRVHECAGCGEEHYDEELSMVYVIPRLDAITNEQVKRIWLENNGPWGCSSFASTKEELENCEYNFFKDDAPNAWICNNKECREKFIEAYLKPGERPHLRNTRWNEEICVYLDQLNADGVEELAWGYENDNEGYIRTFRNYHIQPTKFIELL